MKILCVLLLLFLTGCGDRYSLDEKRGPDPKGFVTNHPLSLPPDYMLRAPEPVAKEKEPEKEEKEPQKAEEKKTSEAGEPTEKPQDANEQKTKAETVRN